MIQRDEPMSKPEEDVLGRTPVSAAIAKEIQTINPARCAVVGILGPSGSGKSSLINLIRNELTSRSIESAGRMSSEEWFVRLSATSVLVVATPDLCVA